MVFILIDHIDNSKSNLSVLRESLPFGINGKFGSTEKRLVLILVNHSQNFVYVCIIKLIRVICLLMEKKSLSLRSTIKLLTFQLNFVLEVYLMILVLLSLENFL